MTTELEIYVAGLKQEIEALNAKRRWIPVEERLPEEGSNFVLVRVKHVGEWHNGETDYDLAFYSTQVRYWGLAQTWELGDPVVTHWQELTPLEEAE